LNCIDSDLAIALLKGDEKARDEMVSLENDDEVCITSISVFELLHTTRGFSKERKDLLMNLLEELRVLDLDKRSAMLAGVVGTTLTRTGRSIHPMDLLIAGICINNKVPLITRNVRHFNKVKDLKIRKW